jgi:hypothetical protein
MQKQIEAQEMQAYQQMMSGEEPDEEGPESDQEQQQEPQ